jgi:hypothetical protein
MTKQQPLFPLGKCYMTPAIKTLVEQQALAIHEYLYRHQRGDWGNLTQEDVTENEKSLQQGFRIFSAYNVEAKNAGSNAIKIWVITEADRSTTTVLLPEEY